MSGDETRDQLNDAKRDLSDAKLDLIRNEMRNGFASLAKALTSHVAEDEKAHSKVDGIEERVRALELENARIVTKFQIYSALIGIGSGGGAALLSKLFG